MHTPKFNCLASEQELDTNTEGKVEYSHHSYKMLLMLQQARRPVTRNLLTVNHGLQPGTQGKEHVSC